MARDILTNALPIFNRKLHMGRKVRWAAFVGLVMLPAGLVLSGLILLGSYRHQLQLERRLDVAQNARGEMYGLLRYATQAESSQRGFLLSGNPAFLLPYYAALDKLPEFRQQLSKDLTVPGQQEQFAIVSQLLGQKLDYLAQSIELRRTGEPETLLRLRKSGRGERYMSGIRQGTARLIALQLASVHRQEAELEQAGRETALLVAGMFTGMFVLIIGAAALVALAFRDHEAYEQRLRIASEQAEAANHAKSEFLANMSHEIRTPLNGVVAVADMLSRANLESKEREMVEIICASGDTLQRLLSDILDVARMESGKITIEAAVFHAGDMARSVAGLSQLKCDEKGVRLVIEVAPEIDQTVMGDLVRVRQVVTNLLSNAVKFTEKGEVRLIADRTPDGAARFTVIDTGVGFPMADKAKVLGRFEQADSSIARRFGGTGLGLSICRDLAKLMGGALDCSSEPGVGSRFWVELPLEAAELEPTPEVEIASEGMDQAMRILLADDHPTNRKVVELMLEGGLADLTSVEDGAQALEKFRAQPFELVLMDMQMPVMDGLTAIREIRRVELEGSLPRTPVIMLTANALPDQIAAAVEAGADLHLSKPFTAGALFDAINLAMTRSDSETLAA